MLDRLTIEQMAARAGEGPILVALSGGGDSVALLHLLTERFGAARLHAGVVDHALREGSGSDAQRALGFAEALGVAGAVLTLAWPDGANRAQQAARRARYAALCEHARAIGAQVIAAAHTADDQAETILMRAAGGSGYRGLAGMAPMAPAPLWPEGRGLTLARPLLHARRAMLRELLRARDAQWLEDPANANPRFERVQVRARLGELEAAGLDPLRLVQIGARLRAHLDRTDAAAAALIAGAARINARITIDIAGWRGPADVRQRALSALMAAAAGADREAADMDVVEPRVFAADYRGGAHGGVRFVREAGRLVLGRDPGAVRGRADGVPALPALALEVGREAIWDGRFAFTARVSGWSAAPADNADVVVLTRGQERRRVELAGDIVAARPLATERVRHALWRAVNDAQPK